MYLHLYLFWLKYPFLRIVHAIVAIVLASVSAMIAFYFLALFAGAPMAGGAHAFGHIIAVTLPEDVPWWPWRIPIAGTTMSRVDSISG